jgi:hypothetical protein
VTGDHTFVAQWKTNANPAPVKPAKKRMPQTSDPTLTMSALGLMAACGAGLVGTGLKRRKREDDEE